MQGVIRIISGSEFGRVIQLDSSRSLMVGRSEEADIAVTSDGLMSSRHCRITPSADGFQLEDLNSTNGTFVNGEQVSRRLLRDGDTLRCGDTEFQAAIDMQGGAASPPQQAAPAPAATPVPATPAPKHEHQHHARTAAVSQPVEAPSGPIELGPDVGYLSQSAMSIVDRFGLVKVIEAVPGETESVEEYLDRAVGEGHLGDAIKFLAYALPSRTAIHWARQCVLAGTPGEPTPQDAQVLDVAGNWLLEPNEGLRRRAMSAAEEAEFGTAAAWVGMGVFWSHGSMGPPTAPAVPPTPDLVGKAISGAVQLAAVMVEPENAEQKQKQFIGLAREMASTPKPWSAK